MRSMKLAVALALVASSSAFGAFAESEPNNTSATANPIVLPSCLSADVGLATLAVGGGDIDYYSVIVPSGCILNAMTTPMATFPSTPDTIMDVRTAGDVLILSNDDGASGTGNGNNGGTLTNRGSTIRFLNNGPTATYLLKIYGFDAAQVGQYALTVSLVPEPATLALLSIGALALIRRRK